MTRALAAALVVSAALLVACGNPEEATLAADGSTAEGRFVALDPPAIPGSFAPDLWSDEQGLVMTWLEPLGESREDGHRVRFARLEEDGWSAPATIFQGQDFFANWADFPSVARTEDGTLYAHWLGKTGAETYAYSIFLARSADAGTSWQLLGKLNDDSTDTEHGFVSWVRDGDAVRAFWLDGREMADGGPMTLRTARVSAEGAVGEVAVLDERVCECCSTDAAVTETGPMVVYRDRSQDEVRDVYRVALSTEEWSSPAPVAVDKWTIEGCPVNGPEIAALGDRVFVTWFTAAEDRAQVRFARSVDGGTSFEEAVGIDNNQPFGRVDVAATEDGGAVLTWLGRQDDGAAIYLRTVDPDGVLGERQKVAETSAARASGFPRLTVVRGDIFLAWVELEADVSSQVRARKISISTLAG